MAYCRGAVLYFCYRSTGNPRTEFTRQPCIVEGADMSAQQLSGGPSEHRSEVRKKDCIDVPLNPSGMRNKVSVEYLGACEQVCA